MAGLAGYSERMQATGKWLRAQESLLDIRAWQDYISPSDYARERQNPLK
jgi:hypothetical protein